MWLLTVLFIGLKLTGFIDWSWWWVLSPTLAEIAFVVVVLLAAALTPKYDFVVYGARIRLLRKMEVNNEGEPVGYVKKMDIKPDDFIQFTFTHEGGEDMKKTDKIEKGFPDSKYPPKKKK